MFRPAKSLIVTLSLAFVGSPLLGADLLATVQGGGAFGDRGGVYDNHQPYFDHISVQTRLYDDGTADGVMVWTSQWNAEISPPHSDTYATQWTILISEWIYLDDRYVILIGTVVHSTLESDVESHVAMPFFDGGPNAPDSIGGTEIDGNIIIRSR